MLRRSLPPILCLVLSLFRLFRTLLQICPSGSSALAISVPQESCSISLLYSVQTFRLSSESGTCHVEECHSILSSATDTWRWCRVFITPPLELMTFVALLCPSIITVISLSHIMQIAMWRLIRVFASRYLKEDSSAQDDIRRFGPLGFAGDRMHSRPPQHNH